MSCPGPGLCECCKRQREKDEKSADEWMNFSKKHVWQFAILAAIAFGVGWGLCLTYVEAKARTAAASK